MKPRYSDWALLKRIAFEARPYWPQLAAVLFASLLSTPVAMLTPLPLKIVIDSVFGSRALPPYIAAFWPAANLSNSALALAPCLMVLVIVLTYLQGSGSWFLQTYVGEKIALGFRSKLFAHVQRLSLAHHDLEGTASSTFRIQYDSAAIQGILLGGLLPLLTSAFRLACMIWVTWRIDAQLALVALAAAPVLSWLTFAFGRRLRGRWMGERELNSSANSLVQEVLGATRTVRAF